jgi:hypothetical protein
MKKVCCKILACGSTALLGVSVAFADSGAELPSILADETTARTHYLPDFSYAGFGNGVAEIPAVTGTVVQVDDFGAVANDGKDDTKAVLDALSHAHAANGPVVFRFGPGRYRITEVLSIGRSDFLLQGSGSGVAGTTLHFPRPLMQVDKSDSLDELRKYLVDLDKRQVEPDVNLNEYFSEYSWSGGFIWIQKPGTRAAPYLEEYDPQIEKLADIRSGTRGNKRITVSDAGALNAGDIVQVQWINNSGPDAAIIKSLYGSEYKTAGSHHWTFPGRPLVRQTSRIELIDGDLGWVAACRHRRAAFRVSAGALVRASHGAGLQRYLFHQCFRFLGQEHSHHQC